MPTVFITRKENFFNACAAKVLTSSGGIVIGQDLIVESSEKELEAIVARMSSIRALLAYLYRQIHLLAAQTSCL